MANRIFIDINTAVGRTSYRDSRFPFDEVTLEKEMAYYGINGYAAFNSEAVEYSFVKGNREILRMAENNKRIIPCGVVVPTLKYECDDWREYLDGLIRPASENHKIDVINRNIGMKAFHMYPVAMNYRFDPYYIREIAEYMIEKNIPLIIDNGQFEYRDLENVLAAFPKLNVILCKSRFPDTRNIYSVMDRFSNVYVDLCGNQGFDFIKICKKHFGIDRILYSSGYPYMCPGAAKGTIEYSDLNEEEKDKVAHGNIAGLLGINIADYKPYSDEERGIDTIASMAEKGEPFTGITVIDSHVHSFEESDFTNSSFPVVNASTTSLICKMDRMGVDKAFISVWEGLFTDGMSANETAIKEKLKHGDRIEFYSTCNGNYRKDIDEITEYHEKMRSQSNSKYNFIGIKPYYCYNGYDIEGPAYEKWYEYADKHHLLALIHVDGSCESAVKTNRLAKKYKNITFILAHAGQSYHAAEKMIPVAQENKNVMLEITYSSVTYGIIEYLVEKAGADKILYGSDSLMREPAAQLAWLCFAKISVEDKKKILGENAIKLLRKIKN